MSSGLPPEQLLGVNLALESAHWLFVSISGYPIIRVTRYGRQLTAGQPQFNIAPTYENLTFTTFAEMDEVEQDEINVSGGNIQVGDRRMSTRVPIYNTDRIEMTELLGIQELSSNSGTGGLLTIIVSPNTPGTDFTLKFTSSIDFTVTKASGSIGAGNMNTRFISSDSNITIHSTSWFGAPTVNDKFLFRTVKNIYNVYRMEAINSFGGYEFLVRLIGER